jgi:hypothetical protein
VMRSWARQDCQRLRKSARCGQIIAHNVLENTGQSEDQTRSDTDEEDSSDLFPIAAISRTLDGITAKARDGSRSKQTPRRRW